MNFAFRALALGAVAAAVWLAWPGADRPASAPPPPKATRPAPAARADGLPFFATVPGAPPPVSGAASLAATRQHGDPEAPPIARAPIVREPPNAHELADPKAYEAYEARETQRTYAAYIRAVDEELPRLRADIERGRAMGIAPEKIAMAEDKARRLGLMRAQLAQELQAALSPPPH
jgi:hypothetical protein